MLLILTFVPQETRPLLRYLRDARRVRPRPGIEPPAPRALSAWSGELGGLPTTIATVGIGAKSAVAGLDYLRAALPADAVAVCGVAAALDASLAVGDVVLASQVENEAGRRFQPHAPELPAALALPPARAAAILSVDRILITAAQKAACPPAAAADMESAAIALATESAGLPWCALRAISDTSAEHLPLDFNRCLGDDGQLHLGALLRTLAARPGAIPGLIRLSAGTSRAAQAVARFAAAYLPLWYRSLNPGD